MSLALISGGKVKTSQELTKLSTPFFRDFMQGEGTVVQGTWVWFANASQTDYASYKSEGAGFFYNSTSTINDEYKWSDIFLAKGTYMLKWRGVCSANCGTASFLLGSRLILGTNLHTSGTNYNMGIDWTFQIEKDTTGDFRFVSTGVGTLIDFSRLTLEKIG